jgi:hypothetical protein
MNMAEKNINELPILPQGMNSKQQFPELFH